MSSLQQRPKSPFRRQQPQQHACIDDDPPVRRPASSSKNNSAQKAERSAVMRPATSSSISQKVSAGSMDQRRTNQTPVRGSQLAADVCRDGQLQLQPARRTSSNRILGSAVRSTSSNGGDTTDDDDDDRWNGASSAGLKTPTRATRRPVATAVVLNSSSSSQIINNNNNNSNTPATPPPPPKKTSERCKSPGIFSRGRHKLGSPCGDDASPEKAPTKKRYAIRVRVKRADKLDDSAAGTTNVTKTPVKPKKGLLSLLTPTRKGKKSAVHVGSNKNDEDESSVISRLAMDRDLSKLALQWHDRDSYPANGIRNKSASRGRQGSTDDDEDVSDNDTKVISESAQRWYGGSDWYLSTSTASQRADGNMSDSSRASSVRRSRSKPDLTGLVANNEDCVSPVAHKEQPTTPPPKVNLGFSSPGKKLKLKLKLKYKQDQEDKQAARDFEEQRSNNSFSKSPKRPAGVAAHLAGKKDQFNDSFGTTSTTSTYCGEDSSTISDNHTIGSNQRGARPGGAPPGRLSQNALSAFQFPTQLVCPTTPVQKKSATASLSGKLQGSRNGSGATASSSNSVASSSSRRSLGRAQASF